ncbi:hypothetical protein K4A83_08655 [Spirulina subsalsa FACHB-351]|uniref:Uncharacterized protein n=1 Tax=Spirulina subsalsa FACHB-351 TaxID=234711 RepID=A0ABT3L5E8_9CYAN|nr:hypothetical protein [Spirulina subsalsa]MCW6036339.1 hypothetical protein [Spirulina subsalsa FACHB-351]
MTGQLRELDPLYRSYSFKFRLNQHLTQVLLKLSREENDLAALADITDIPCLQVLGKWRYQSALALKISGKYGKQSEEIAQQLLRNFPDSTDFLIKRVQMGRLEWEVRASAIASWLTQCLHLPPSPEKLQISKLYRLKSLDKSHIIPIQYTYNRCVSLLHLGASEQLIQLSPPLPDQVRTWLAPQPPPWTVNSAPLPFQHPAEINLIATQIQIMDAITYPPSGGSSNLGLALSEAFLEFHRSCRIWGEVQQHTPQLSQGRLGLIQVTQNLLQLMLGSAEKA